MLLFYAVVFAALGIAAQAGPACAGSGYGLAVPGPGSRAYPFQQAGAAQVYYEPTIKNIIAADCARCHSGATMNLMDYDSLKIYVDSGMLDVWVNGPMRRFAGGDARTLLDWISSGAPEKPAAAAAGFTAPGPGSRAYPLQQAGAAQVYYEPTIKNIIAADCAQCHSGATRNLMDYDSLKMYADSGMLDVWVNGSMRRFAGNDARTLLDWIRSGAPEKPAAAAANFRGRPVRPPVTGKGGNTPAQITYTNTIQYILAQDCLRCHSGQFRNLTTYKHVKMYVDNGLLKFLLQPGGCMRRFGGPEDSQVIIDWVDSGAAQ